MRRIAQLALAVLLLAAPGMASAQKGKPGSNLWIRSAQLRAYLRENVGSDWWERSETGEFLRGLFAEGTRPSSEDVAARLGFEPLDLRPLLQETAAAS